MNDPFLPEELRLFIACELPESWTEALQQAQRDLSKAGLGYLRWVRPEGIHLTLKFLGETGRHLLPDIEAGMKTASQAFDPFELRLAGLGTFGSRGRVRVLWAGIEGDLKTLSRLQASTNAAMGEIGFARETRPFSAHLTLARVPDDAPADTTIGVAAALRSAKLPDVDSYHVEEVSLIRSQLGRGGAVYTRLAAARLGAERPATE